MKYIVEMPGGDHHTMRLSDMFAREKSPPKDLLATCCLKGNTNVDEIVEATGLDTNDVFKLMGVMQ